MEHQRYVCMYVLYVIMYIIIIGAEPLRYVIVKYLRV